MSRLTSRPVFQLGRMPGSEHLQTCSEVFKAKRMSAVTYWHYGDLVYPMPCARTKGLQSTLDTVYCNYSLTDLVV